MHNCNFNKTALLVDFRRIIWRLDQYRKDAKSAGHPLCEKMLNDIEVDLKKHSKKRKCIGKMRPHASVSPTKWIAI